MHISIKAAARRYVTNAHDIAYGDTVHHETGSACLEAPDLMQGRTSIYSINVQAGIRYSDTVYRCVLNTMQYDGWNTGPDDLHHGVTATVT